jgi:hypothetical protein
MKKPDTINGGRKQLYQAVWPREHTVTGHTATADAEKISKRPMFRSNPRQATDRVQEAFRQRRDQPGTFSMGENATGQGLTQDQPRPPSQPGQADDFAEEKQIV